jgi:hypothetical protein
MIFDDDDGDDDASGDSRRATGVGDTFGDEDEDDDEDEDVVVVLVLVVWASSAALLSDGEGETAVPKGVSSIFILEEDATFPVAGCCTRDDCAAARALSLRW